MDRGDAIGERDVAGEPNETSELAEAERELARAARATLGFADDLDHGLPRSQRRRLLVLHNLLGD